MQCGIETGVLKIARKFREQKEEAEKKVGVLEKEKIKLLEELELKLEEEEKARADSDEDRIERIRELERETEKLKEEVEMTKKDSEAEMEHKMKKLEEGFANRFNARQVEFTKIIRAKEIETGQLKTEAKKMKEEVEKNKTALEEAKKKVAEVIEAFEGDNEEIHKQFNALIDKREERIRVLEIETENLKEENKELQRAKDTTSAGPSSFQIVEIENAETQEDVFVTAEDPKENVELKQENLERTLTGSEDAGPAGTSVQKSTDGKNENLRNPMPQKRRSSDTKDNILASIRKEHEMFRTIIESGLSQLIQDEDTPVTMLGSLKALKNYTTSSSMKPQRKRRKHTKIQKVLKQDPEYFEHDAIKKEPGESKRSVQASEEQQHD